MKEIICGIYKITSPSSKIYIGQAFDIEKRWKRYNNFNCKAQPHLYNSLLKYGVENHKFEVIHQCEYSDLDNLENFYIQKFDCFNSAHGMNLRSGGGRGGLLSDVSKAKSGESQKLNWAKRKANGTHRQTRETVNKRMASYRETVKRNKENGKVYKHSEASKEKKRIKMKEFYKKLKENPEYYSPTQVQKRKDAAKRGYQTFIANGNKRTKSSTFNVSGKNNPFYGKTHTKETLQKIAVKRKVTWAKKIADGWKQSKEHIAKRVKKQVGQKRSGVALENIRRGAVSKKENGYYDKNKEKISETRKLVWQKIKSNNFYSEEEKAKRTIIANKIWANRRANKQKNQLKLAL